MLTAKKQTDKNKKQPKVTKKSKPGKKSADEDVEEKTLEGTPEDTSNTKDKEPQEEPHINQEDMAVDTAIIGEEKREDSPANTVDLVKENPPTLPANLPTYPPPGVNLSTKPQTIDHFFKPTTTAPPIPPLPQ